MNPSEETPETEDARLVAQLEAAADTASAGEGDRCEDCNEVHDEDQFGLNELQGTIVEFMRELGLGDLAEDLRQVIADQRRHEAAMEGITNDLVRAVDAVNRPLEGEDRLEWAMFRTSCGCVLPMVRVGDEWTSRSERFAEVATSEQVRQIVEAMALLGRDLLNVARELEKEGR